MGLLDTILGRTKPKKPDLDRLFALPSAAVTLEVSEGLRSTGAGGVVLKPASGRAFTEAYGEVEDLVGLAAKEAESQIRQVQDRYDYQWLIVEDPQLDELVTTVHMVNSTLTDRGFGPQLLASVFAFKGEQGETVDLVYLYKRGTFYPFVPLGGERRDNTAELRIRDVVSGDLPIEEDLTRWFPIWDAPVN
jgi:hypothetical protein